MKRQALLRECEDGAPATVSGATLSPGVAFRGDTATNGSVPQCTQLEGGMAHNVPVLQSGHREAGRAPTGCSCVAGTGTKGGE